MPGGRVASLFEGLVHTIILLWREGVFSDRLGRIAYEKFGIENRAKHQLSVVP